jgi:hypothetical protein
LPGAPGESYISGVIDDDDDNSNSAAGSTSAAPRTLNVLGLLALTALTFSYLGAYAVTGALVAEQFMPQWPREHDPRPRWLLTGFCVLMLCFMAAGAALRRMSNRAFAQMDAMVDAADEPGGKPIGPE